MTNVEGRILLRRKAFDPPAGARSDLEIMRGIADRLGRGEFFPTDPAAVFAELGRASAGGAADYAGITLDRLRAGEQLFWPCPSAGPPGHPADVPGRASPPRTAGPGSCRSPRGRRPSGPPPSTRTC